MPAAAVPTTTLAFSLKLANWLGLEDAAAVEVVKVNLDAPTVQMSGYGASTAQYVSDDLKITASATMPACGGGRYQTSREMKLLLLFQLFACPRCHVVFSLFALLSIWSLVFAPVTQSPAHAFPPPSLSLRSASAKLSYLWSEPTGHLSSAEVVALATGQDRAIKVI